MQARSSLNQRFESAVRLLVLFNLVDAVATAWWVQAGWASEANPVMAAALELGVGAFIATKLLFGGGGALVLRAFADRRISWFGLHGSLVAYALVLMLHASQVVSQIASGTLASVNW